MTIEVAILALDDAVPFDVAVPCQLFAPEPNAGLPRYNVAVCGESPGNVQTANGFALAVTHGLEAIANATTIVATGTERADPPLSPDVARALRDAQGRGARMVSICTGAFILAAAGVLDGHRATTHWRHVDELRARYPRVDVVPDVLFVHDDNVFTSAGLAAGIDLCLYIIGLDHGAEAANAVSRQMVVAPYRPGDQTQTIHRPVPRSEDAGLADTRVWLLQHLDAPLSIDEMASHANMSRRTFTRTFRDETGVSPLQWLLYQRIDLARRLLEATDDPIETIPARCGFETAAAFRTQFRRFVGTTPSTYREKSRDKAVSG